MFFFFFSFQVLDSLTSMKILDSGSRGLLLRTFKFWQNLMISVGFEHVNLRSWGEHIILRQLRPNSSLNCVNNTLTSVLIEAFWHILPLKMTKSLYHKLLLKNKLSVYFCLVKWKLKTESGWRIYQDIVSYYCLNIHTSIHI